MALALLPLAAAEPDQRLQSRIDWLEARILAPCCYAEPVSRHQSEAAVKARLEIRRWLEEGKSDAAILDAYRARYGDRVIVEPPRESWLWYKLPWAVIALAALAVVWLLRRWRRPAAAAPVTAGPALPPLPETDEDWSGLDHIR